MRIFILPLSKGTYLLSKNYPSVRRAQPSINYYISLSNPSDGMRQGTKLSRCTTFFGRIPLVGRLKSVALPSLKWICLVHPVQ